MKPVSPRYPTYVIYEGYDLALALGSVGKGWASLIHEVFSYIENNKISVKIIQVKEKYGGLRIYFHETNHLEDSSYREFSKFIMDAENRSLKMCETCGNPGLLRGKSWYYTSCDLHAKHGDLPHDWQPGDPHEEN